MDPLAEFLQALGGSGNAPTPAPAPSRAPSSIPAPVKPIVPVERLPQPQPRPSLPGGSFAPNSKPQPMPQQAPQQADPLASILNNLRGGGFKNYARSVGAGMNNASGASSGFGAFARGFGGATGYNAEREATERDRAIAEQERQAALASQAEQIRYDRQQDSANMELRRAADARQERRLRLDTEKTQTQMEREARQKGLTINQVLEVERIAQAAGEGVFDAGDRTRVVEEKRQQLYQQLETMQGDEPKSLATPELRAEPLPNTGAVVDGYRYLGGDPNDQNSWEAAV